MTIAHNSVETPRLLLREPELADAQAFMGIMWDPEVVEQKQVTLLEPPGGLDLALKNTGDMRRQWELRGYGQWSVVEKLTGEVIGIVGFYHPPREWPGVDLGWVVHRSRWGHGFATEAAMAALGWIWEHTPVDRIISLIAPDDLRSIRVATKIGRTLRAGRHRPREWRSRARLHDRQIRKPEFLRAMTLLGR